MSDMSAEDRAETYIDPPYELQMRILLHAHVDTRVHTDCSDIISGAGGLRNVVNRRFESLQP